MRNFELCSSNSPGLHEHQPVLVSELLGLLVGDVPLCLQITLVPDEEDHSVGVGQVARVCQPGGEVVVSRPVNKIILGNIFST